LAGFSTFWRELWFRGYILPRQEEGIWQPGVDRKRIDVHSQSYLAALELAAHLTWGAGGGVRGPTAKEHVDLDCFPWPGKCDLVNCDSLEWSWVGGLSFFRRIMRSEREMLELIIDTARDDERIRAVIMNGSRANPNAPRDPFQDFDIVYIVTDVAAFKYNYEWIKRFGELMIMQMPEDMQDPPPSDDGGFAYLMQFTDGNRIDLGIYPLEKLNDLGKDSLSLLLLDKDGIIAPFPPASESDYLPNPPTAKAFSDCCNEFWWVCPYVAKGLWREEILYAKSMCDQAVREQLTRMLTWHIGVKTQFSRNVGKQGKYFRRY
jgi:aminoglycoside 6-adenylyltransferase